MAFLEVMRIYNTSYTVCYHNANYIVYTHTLNYRDFVNHDHSPSARLDTNISSQTRQYITSHYVIELSRNFMLVRSFTYTCE